ncbi:hypothetical protein [Riemerella columbipharyngis]|uniref:Bacteriophage CI repressor helix-turn-helix domain-containing protein n=1 Tax=Riemerella columbipharyngis TaxID=1071918 RepID=A0A1G7EYQ2_9FLAO|nr:hypothetical protein [Riemerella columbipharyngis]SDE68840.1 hypothetical protein SAMN05421544_11828 [Riemerella columbipharyngis]
MTITERILQYIDYKGISKYRFCKDLKFSQSFLDKKRKITTDKYANILVQYPEINPEWLLTGEGNMLRNEHITENKDTNIDNISNTKDEISLLRKENESLKREVALLNENRELLTYKLQNLEKEISKINEENSTIKSKPQNRAAG